MTPDAFWRGSLAEAWVYIDVAARRRDDQKTLFAWLIASVANIAGAKPKVTVASLLKEKSAQVDQPMLAAMLSTISTPKGQKKPKQTTGKPTEAEARAALEAFNAEMRSQQAALKEKGSSNARKDHA